MKTKNVKNNNFEDSKYCYVILRKGERPTLITSTNADKPSLDVDDKRGSIHMLYNKCCICFQERILTLIILDLTVEAYHWSRLIMPPMKRSEHVVMDYCSKTGKIA